MPRLNRSVIALALSVVIALAAGAPAHGEEPCADLGFRSEMVETAPGIELYVRRGGNGPVVVIPGGFLVFDALCGLADDFSLVFYDMRNRGRSSPVRDGALLTLEADVEDLEALRRHDGIEAMSLIGYSYLGKMVVEYVLGHPQRVERIVQLGPVQMDPGRTLPPAFTEASLLDTPGAQGRIAELRALRAEGLHEEDPRRYCELEWELTRAGLVGDPAVAETIPSRCDMPNEWPTNLAFHMQHHFMGSMLSAVTTAAEAATVAAPVLVVHGTRDRNAPFGGGLEWAAALPEARLLKLPGLAHATFREVDLVPAIAGFFRGNWPAEAQVVEPAFHGHLSQLHAWHLLRDALAAHAPDGIPTAGALSSRWSGALYPRSQSRTSEPPFEPAFPVLSEVVFDPRGGRVEHIEEVRWPEFTSRFRTVVTAGDSFDVDLVTGAVGPTFREPDEELARAARSIPALLLDELLEVAAGSLRFDGAGRLGGEPVTLVSASHRGERLDLYLAADRTVAAIGRLVEEPMLGDAYELTRLLGHQELAGLIVPESMERRLQGIEQPRAVVELQDLAWTPIEEERYQRPTAPAGGDDGDTSAAGPPSLTPPGSAGLRELAPGVHLAVLPNAADYNSLIVERSDHLVVVEAPVGPEPMRWLLSELEERFPDKPVRWLVVTHHHFDHSGGVPTLAAAGPTLVTTPGNVGFFRHAIGGPHTLAGTESEVPEITAVTQVWEVPGGAPAIHVVPANPTHHVEEMLFVHLPAERLIFQGDLARFPLVEWTRPAAATLVERIDELGLDVHRIAGVHGEVGELADLRRALAARPRE